MTAVCKCQTLNVHFPENDAPVPLRRTDKIKTKMDSVTGRDRIICNICSNILKIEGPKC